MATILQVARDAAVELSLVQPSSLFPTVDDGDSAPQKLLRALQRVTKGLAAGWDWQVLRRQWTFATVASEVQTGVMPSDFLRFIPETFWDRTRRWRVTGPLPPLEWSALTSGYQVSVYPSFIQRGNDIHLLPVPGATSETMAFEYITNAIGTDKDGAALTAFAADTDVTLFDGELLTLGVIARYRQAEGFDYAEATADFERARMNALKQDGGRRVLDMDGGVIGSANARLRAMRNAAVVVTG